MIDISVIVPVYNSEAYLDKCISDILAQTYTNFEVIFVNDGSTDSSLDILNSYVDARFKVVDQANQGQAVARNNAIKMAQGEYITFVDSDDRIDPTMFEALMRASNNKKADIVWCDMATFSDEKNYNRIYSEFSELTDSKKSYILHNAGPCAKIIRTDLIVKNNLYFLTNHVYEDIAIVPAYALYANEIVYVDAALYFYRMHEGSTMKQVSYNRKLEDIFDSMDHLSSYFKGTYAEEMEYLYIKHLLHAASLRFYPYEQGDKHRIKINAIMKKQYPKWHKNVYYRQNDIKFKIVCNLLYRNCNALLSKILK